MTTNNVHVLASGRRVRQLVLLERSQTESMIAVRAIRRLLPEIEVRPVMNLAEARGALAGMRVAAALVASGLDDRTCFQTIRRFARKGCGIVIAMLEECDDRQRQEAVEAGASHVCSKPELLIAQLRYELGARLGSVARSVPDCWVSVRWHGWYRLPVPPEQQLTMRQAAPTLHPSSSSAGDPI